MPSSIEQSNLQYLKLNKCTRLHSLPQLPQSLVTLDAIGCSSLKTVQYTSRQKGHSYTSFLNCMELDERSVKVILANFLLPLNQLGAYDYVAEIITDQSVDEGEAEATIADDGDQKNLIKTFYFQKDVDNLTSDHVFLWYDDDFCCKLRHEVMKSRAAKSKILFKLKIVPQFSHVRRSSRKHFEIITNQSVDEAEAIIADDKDQKNLIKTFYFRKNVDNLTSDHVFLWYDDDLSYKLQHEVKKSGAAKLKILFKLKIVPQFGHVRRSSRKHLEVIKECGVCPTNYFKFQNFIHELELEVESEASASGMGVGSSYHQCKDEEETITPMQKSKGFIFSPFPTTSWKNGTQGFKDIFNL
ncbi:disease resistance-like protein DSC1 [Senna tora]|uniref:Disease resistance-like protein DSC1 n=1 Tax=Senna tora TaxID=362788 RepID=A0A834T1L0_9FABA|nr:disease resistance-like protein DSC1 [Senna tora]